MIILALESSAKPASVAVTSDGSLLGYYYQNNGLTHSRTLLVMAQSLLRSLDVSMSDIGLIAVSSGPGSFTGVRIGVSAAKGIAWGLGIPVCGVSTLEAMTYQSTEPGVVLCPVMDARRNQVYNALFEWKDSELKRLSEDRAISCEDLATELRTLSARPGIDHQNTGNNTDGQWPPQRDESINTSCSNNLNTTHNAPTAFAAGSPILLLGDGATMCHEYLTSNEISCKLAPEPIRFQNAYGVALAAMSKTPTSAAELEPSYLRPSQAERVRSEQGTITV